MKETYENMNVTINTTRVETTDEEKEIYELVSKLNYYTKLYDEGKSEISDREWDELYFKLQELERKTGFYHSKSPTQRVNYQVVNKLEKVEHNHPMLSLDKTKDIDVIKSFIRDKDWICMAKMDGLTCSLRYLNGKLISAETRGNGLVGENILHNALQVKNIPKKIDFKEELIVDGEIICTYDNFKYFEKEYKNPRNFASGSIRLLDSEESAMRNLTFVAWDCIKGLENKLLLDEKLKTLQSYGFTVVLCIYQRYSNFRTDIDTLNNAIEMISRQSQDIGYPIDGVVFKYNNCEEYENAGRTDHHFKGGIAYKFYDDEYETKLLDITYDIGRTGQLTPVAVYEPIEIDGTICSRASLHNQTILKETLHGKGWVGQKITVAKANMIIPQITSAEEDNDGLTKEYIDYPYVCPICGEPTTITKDIESEVLYCVNPSCEGLLSNRVEHFFSKKGLDAHGISKTTIEKLIDWEWVKSISDMFTLSLHEKEWKSKTGFGEKSVNNILKSIKESANCNLESVISGAGIPLIGRTVARDLSKRFSSYSEFREAIDGDFDFSSIVGFGYEMNKSIKEFDYTELDYIVKNYLNIAVAAQESLTESNNSLTGQIFCITGKLTHFRNRDELVVKIEELGGKVTGAVSKNTTFLINNDKTSTSAKNLKAQELGIEIISEDDFIERFM